MTGSCVICVTAADCLCSERETCSWHRHGVMQLVNMLDHQTELILKL